MPNHFHILVRQEGDGAISKFVKATFSAYTQALNNQQGFSGSLFQGKTQARHVDSDDYVLQMIRYIHLNPVEARLVAKPEGWEFSDYCEWIKNKELPKVAYEKTERTYRGFYELRQAFFVDGEDYRQFAAEYQQERDILKIGKYLYDE
jgi:hypothetical protein